MTGSLETGKVADMVILNRNPLAMKPMELLILVFPAECIRTENMDRNLPEFRFRLVSLHG